MTSLLVSHTFTPPSNMIHSTTFNWLKHEIWQSRSIFTPRGAPLDAMWQNGEIHLISSHHVVNGSGPEEQAKRSTKGIFQCHWTCGGDEKNRKNIKRIITWVSSSLRRLQYASCYIYFVFKYSWLGLKLWSDASKDLLRSEKRRDEQAVAPVFLLSPKFSPITISLRADRILPGWRNNKLPPGHKMVQPSR